MTQRFSLRRLALAAGLMLTAALGSGCHSASTTGTLFGAGFGALAGNAIGHDTGATLVGTAIGAAVGYAIGEDIDDHHYHHEGRLYRYHDGYRYGHRRHSYPRRYDRHGYCDY